VNRPSNVPKAQALQCPNCGGTVELRGHGQALNAVCVQCLSVLDTSTPALRVLQQFQDRRRHVPRIPLGSRGKLSGVVYEAIGFQVRQIVVDGVAYQWAEYLLYNPYQGYRYLTEYQGHWNDIRTLRALPEAGAARGKKARIRSGGKTYVHFQTATAETVYVLGEFPWQIRTGETVSARDYVCAPDIISAEATADEVVLSHGTYTSGKDIWRAFQLPGKPPQPQGVYANQPNPNSKRLAGVWSTFWLLVIVVTGVLAGVWIFSPRDEVFRQTYAFSSSSGEPSYVTPVFELNGGLTNVKVTINTNLSNDWGFFGMALINDETGVAYDFGEEIGYYYGRDSDGDWTEGSRSGTATIPSVPQGRYYLRVEPDMQDDGRRHAMNYELVVTRGSPGIGWYFVALALILVYPVIVTIRYFSFENARWAESDYGALISSSSGDE
jgi:hypothetical protein